MHGQEELEHGQEELKPHDLSQYCEVFRLLEMWWDRFLSLGDAVEGYRLCRREDEYQGDALCVKEHLRYMELL